MASLFLNVDVQHDFMSPEGALSIPGAMEIVPNIKNLVEFARENKIPIVHTADWHTSRDPEISEQPDFKQTFPPHCMEMSPGALLIPEVRPVNPAVLYYNCPPMDDWIWLGHPETVVLKNKFDLFAGNKYSSELFLRIPPFDRVVVFGVAANVCVDQAIRGLLRLQNNIKDGKIPFKRPLFTITAVHDATKGINCEEGKTFADWFDLGVTVSSAADVLLIAAKNP